MAIARELLLLSCIFTASAGQKFSGAYQLLYMPMLYQTITGGPHDLMRNVGGSWDPLVKMCYSCTNDD